LIFQRKVITRHENVDKALEERKGIEGVWKEGMGWSCSSQARSYGGGWKESAAASMVNLICTRRGGGEEA
jgi:hypothetical protein